MQRRRPRVRRHNGRIALQIDREVRLIYGDRRNAAVRVSPPRLDARMRNSAGGGNDRVDRGAGDDSFAAARLDRLDRAVGVERVVRR